MSSSHSPVDNRGPTPLGWVRLLETPDCVDPLPAPTLPTGLASGLGLKQIPALDGLRAVAVFLVVFLHLGFTASPGGEGVLIFLVMSGFLITWLLLKEQDTFGAVSLRLFYIRRTLRIFPAFYVYWVFAFIMLATRNRLLWGQAIASFFYVNNYYQAFFGDPNTGLSHTWSLGIEEQFYLLWAPVFIWLQSVRRETVAKLLAAAIVTVWIWRIELVWAGVHQGYIYSAFDTRADQLMLGCLLAFSLRLPTLRNFWNALCASIGYSALLFAIFISSMLLQYRFGHFYRDTVGFAVNGVTVALLIPLLVCFQSSLAWSWLNLRPIRYLGRISYSIYLYQQITPSIVRRIMPGTGGAAFMVVDVIVLLLAATGSYYFIERPLMRLKQRFEGHKRVPLPTPPTSGLSFDVVAVSPSLAG